MFRALITAVVFLSFLSSAFGQERHHPFLFLTRDDIARAKAAIETNKDFAKVVSDFVSRAKNLAPDTLPEFETCSIWVRIMFGFTEKLEVMKGRAIKDCTKTGILIGQGSKNLVFR